MKKVLELNIKCWCTGSVLGCSNLPWTKRRKHASTGAPLISLVWKQFYFPKVSISFLDLNKITSWSKSAEQYVSRAVFIKKVFFIIHRGNRSWNLTLLFPFHPCVTFCRLLLRLVWTSCWRSYTYTSIYVEYNLQTH